jgi:pilus assembly protein CpaB
MKPKTTVLLVLAIGCGLAAAFMTQRILAQRDQKAPEPELVDVVVCKKEVPPQTVIRNPDDYFVVEKRGDGVPASAVRDLKNLTNVRISRKVKEGDYVLADNVESKESLGLTADVPKGKIAAAIRVNAEKLTGGFVKAGHHVDVVWTYKLREVNGREQVGAGIILQNMEVLAVDTETKKTSDGSTTKIGQTVTIAVSPEESMKLKLAQDNGDVSLALRSVGDDTRYNTKELKLPDLLAAVNKGEKGSDTIITAPLPPVDPRVDVKPTDPKYHELVVVDGGGGAVTYRTPIDEKTGQYGVDVKKTELDPKKHDPKK